MNTRIPIKLPYKSVIFSRDAHGVVITEHVEIKTVQDFIDFHKPNTLEKLEDAIASTRHMLNSKGLPPLTPEQIEELKSRLKSIPLTVPPTKEGRRKCLLDIADKMDAIVKEFSAEQKPVTVTGLDPASNDSDKAVIATAEVTKTGSVTDAIETYLLKRITEEDRDSIIKVLESLKPDDYSDSDKYRPQ